MAQLLAPTSDDDNPGSWQEEAGNADANSFDELDEGFPSDDTGSYWSEDPASSFGIRPFRWAFPSATDPETDSGHWHRNRTAKSASAGRQVDMQYQWTKGAGATVVDTSGTISNINEVWTTRQLELSAAETGNIDYADIELTLEFIGVGGGSPRKGWVSTMEVEIPDAGDGPAVVTDQMWTSAG